MEDATDELILVVVRGEGSQRNIYVFIHEVK